MKSIDGFVAFLDVLGFQELLTRDERLAEVTEYIGAVQRAVSDAGEGRALQFALFSDSIVINTVDGEDASLVKLIEACARIFGYLVLKYIPLRGAIAYGSFIRSEESAGGTIVAGRPILEAILTEKRQDWVGVILAPSAVRKIADLPAKLSRACQTMEEANSVKMRLAWLLRLYRHEKVPMHRDRVDAGDAERFRGYAIAPVPEEIKSPLDWEGGLVKLLAAAERMRELAPDPRSQRKCRALAEFLLQTGHAWSSTLKAGIFAQLGAQFDWRAI